MVQSKLLIWRKPHRLRFQPVGNFDYFRYSRCETYYT